MATVTEDGRSIPPPGTLEAFKKYVELEPSGSLCRRSQQHDPGSGGSSEDHLRRQEGQVDRPGSPSRLPLPRLIARSPGVVPSVLPGNDGSGNLPPYGLGGLGRGLPCLALAFRGSHPIEPRLHRLPFRFPSLPVLPCRDLQELRRSGHGPFLLPALTGQRDRGLHPGEPLPPRPLQSALPDDSAGGTLLPETLPTRRRGKGEKRPGTGGGLDYRVGRARPQLSEPG